ncbi:hydroxyisourate hydrolase [Paraburkholderia bonniea]|uniref:hydroxyisourate hydrolase n=1 Tax=Paraburkholderia bonniea TaxID=2152891 RepID=UPI0012927AC2|nr:hydroxyisourate hydrolase [Paraburkholderia bonniea]WJF89141.1 hydroxyisourate hydrolase [Paraburkholderia bonniea]WJF92457.1 hydroxyisourate hydrolase [Paraburkholderia bonniea]
MGKLTTHVLDTANGRPGAALKIELFALDGNSRRSLLTTQTNHDGRCDTPLLEGAAFVTGEYELVFHAGDYFAKQDATLPKPPFVDRVVLRFGVADASAHYHVPLLVSPWSYSTYRGS